LEFYKDIDSKFGVIWKAFRDRSVLSPQAAKGVFMGAFNKSSASLPTHVVDVFVVPDYCAYLAGCMDSQFARYAKQEWTQLQFIFEAVEKNKETYPLGVKTSYRAYCQDFVTEIVSEESPK
jgi:hypothetical protein